MKLPVTEAEAAKLDRARSLLDELNAGLIERGIPVTFGITAMCGGHFGGADGELVPVVTG